MNILITGADGFIGKNLTHRLKNFPSFDIHKITKKTSIKNFTKKVNEADLIFHFAGANREKNKINFKKKNFLLTKKIYELLKIKKKKTKLIYTSTIQVVKKNPYGVSKKQAENLLLKLKNNNTQVFIYRLANVFGKWSKPFYNSVVATFCYQISHNKEIKIIKNEQISLIYIDTLIDSFMKLIKIQKKSNIFQKISNQKKIYVKSLANKLLEFKKKINNSEIPILKNDFEKNLYSTFLSYMHQKKGFFKVKRNIDIRGEFTELFKNKLIGQVSFFSINKNQVRGQHYHDTKTEKFFLIDGKVKFDFFNIVSKKKYSMIITKNTSRVIFTLPGWSHKIKNIGNKTAIFAVWSNEIFDRNKPDTYYYKF